MQAHNYRIHLVVFHNSLIFHRNHDITHQVIEAKKLLINVTHKNDIHLHLSMLYMLMIM